MCIAVIYTDVQLYGFVEVINEKQIFIITIDNNSVFDANCILQIFINGQFQSEQSLFMEKDSQCVKIFEFENLKVGDIVSFEIATDLQNRFTSFNSVKLLSLVDTKVGLAAINPYFEALQKAKGLIV